MNEQPEPGIPEIERLDPGADDDLYWARAHARVMDAAEDALAERRQEAEGSALGRELIRMAQVALPTAVVVASVAALLVFSPRSPGEQVQRPSEGALVGVEELLRERITGWAAELSDGVEYGTFMIAFEEGRR